MEMIPRQERQYTHYRDGSIAGLIHSNFPKSQWHLAYHQQSVYWVFESWEIFTCFDLNCEQFLNLHVCSTCVVEYFGWLLSPHVGFLPAGPGWMAGTHRSLFHGRSHSLFSSKTFASSGNFPNYLWHTHTLHPYLLFCFPESVNIFVGNGFLCSHIYPRYGEKKTQFGLKMTTTTPQPIIFLSTWIRPQSKYFSSPQWTLYIIHVTLNSNEFLCFPFLFSFPFQWKAETNDTVLCGFCSRRVQRAKHISFKHISR